MKRGEGGGGRREEENDETISPGSPNRYTHVVKEKPSSDATKKEKKRSNAPMKSEIKTTDVIRAGRPNRSTHRGKRMSCQRPKKRYKKQYVIRNSSFLPKSFARKSFYFKLQIVLFSLSFSFRLRSTLF